MADLFSAYAHTPNALGNWHSLLEHLRATANLARTYAQVFDAGDTAYLAGLTHDIGKASPDFQVYLRECFRAGRGGPPAPLAGPDHKDIGAAWLYEQGLHPLAFIVSGHHSGLPSRKELPSRLAEALSDANARDIFEWARKLLPQWSCHRASALLPAFLSDPNRKLAKRRMDLFIRMVFSALVDADFLNTEHHFRPERSARRSASPPISELLPLFAANQDELISSAPDTSVNRLRREVYEACLNAAEAEPGVFSLTVPTGGGKTRSAMAFALRHAQGNNLRRVIVAIPYTSITEQTAQVYREIFGETAILEHHSGVQFPEGEDSSLPDPRRLAAENWDRPIIVTTTVQLFESLFSSFPAPCRRLHNLSGSVLVLDEVQTLPLHLLQPILDVLRELVEHYSLSLVLCTATQPAFEGDSPYLSGFGRVQEIAPDPERAFEVLRRVRFEISRGVTSLVELARHLRRYPQCLVVLNSRKDAINLFEALGDPEANHLSTLLCGRHRGAVLRQVRERLKEGKPCRLISTQVVEAGVDLDFPVVFRAFGPLDRIVQVAGRCNREGRLDSPGRVMIFDLEGGTAPRGAYRTAMEEARVLLNRKEIDLQAPRIFQEYFQRLYQDVSTDANNIQELREGLDFPEVARRFKMIREDTQSVVVASYDEQVRSILERLAPKRAITREDWRMLQPYTVTLYRRDMETARRKGLVEELLPGLWIWRGGYDARLGIRDIARDPSDLVL